MNLSKFFRFFFILSFSSSGLIYSTSGNDNLELLELESIKEKHHSDSKCCEKCHTGTAGFSGGPLDWYEIETISFPTTVALSKNRNSGSTQGNIKLKPDGLKIKERGTYWVSLSAILLNQDGNVTPLIPVFLTINGVVDQQNSLGGVVTLPAGLINTVSGSGILEDVAPGTKLSLVATNGGGSNPEPVTVISWGISLFKIPCKSVRE